MDRATTTDIANVQPDNDLKVAVEAIKAAILRSQAKAARMVAGESLSLYFGVGCYVSDNSREKSWGQNAIETISIKLHNELPGLRGFSIQNIRNMRLFAEFWRQYIFRSPMASEIQFPDKKVIIYEDSFSLHKWSPLASEIQRDEFLGVSFSHHMEILHKTKDIQEVLFYIHQTVLHQWNKYELRNALRLDLYHKRGDMPNNFTQTIPNTVQALRAVKMFKDEYLLDFINIEDIDSDIKDIDERVLENDIVRNIRKFIMTFGRDFAYIGNQFHLEVYTEEMFPDLLFFNRALNCLVVVELKAGAFKPAYLGQLHTYLQVLDDHVRKPHENPSIGIILCRDSNKAFAEYAVRDYTKPMGVATYKTMNDMPEHMRSALPDMEELKKLL